MDFKQICNAVMDTTPTGACKDKEVTQATKCYDTSCEGIQCLECGYLSCRDENSCLGASVSTAGNTEVSCQGLNSCGCAEPVADRNGKDSTCATISVDLDVGCDGTASCYRADMIQSQDTVDCEGEWSCSNDIMPYDTDKFPLEVEDASGYEFDVEVNAPTVSCSSKACMGAKLVANDIIQCSGDFACYGSKTKINDKNGEISCGGTTSFNTPFNSLSTVFSAATLTSLAGLSCPTTGVEQWYENNFDGGALEAIYEFDRISRGPMDTGDASASPPITAAPIGQTTAERDEKGLTCADFTKTKTLIATFVDPTKMTRAAVMADPLLDALLSNGACAKAHLRGTLPVGADSLRNDRPSLSCESTYSCYKAAIKMEATCVAADSCMGATFDTDFNCDDEDACHETVAAKGSGAICCGPGCINANKGTDSKDKVHEGCTDEASEPRAGYTKCYKCEKLSALNFLTKTKTGLIILCVFIVLILIGVIVGLVFLKNKMMKPQIENLDAEK